MPEPQVFTSEESTHGPNTNFLPTNHPQGIQLYDAPYHNPSDPFVDEHEHFHNQHLSPEVENLGLLPRPATSQSSSTRAPESSVNGDDDSVINMHYGRIPQRVPRRYKTTKRVPLQNGNLVLDCPVPTKLLDMCHHRDGDEFTHMRYTAATCDPNNFNEENYNLRQQLYSPPRRTEIMICLTMYNEDEFLFTRTMHAVVTNIVHLCSRGRSKTWGDEGWKKVCLILIIKLCLFIIIFRL